MSDPIGTGFAESFSRPGGNVTGFTNIEPTMASKWLELLKEIAPRVARVAFLFNPATAPYAEYYLSPFKVAAASLALEAIPTPVRNTRARIRHGSTGAHAEWRSCPDDGFIPGHASCKDHIAGCSLPPSCRLSVP